jgi:hypothetical protein
MPGKSVHCLAEVRDSKIKPTSKIRLDRFSENCEYQ